MTKPAEVHQHRHAATSLMRERQSMFCKRIGKTSPVGWIGDDVLCQWSAFREEVTTGLPIAVGHEVG